MVYTVDMVYPVEMVYTVDMVYTIDMVYTVDTGDEALLLGAIVLIGMKYEL